MASKKFDSMAAIKAGWNLMKENFWFLAGLLLIQFIVSTFSEKISKGEEQLSGPATLFSIILFILSIFVSMGTAKIILNLIDKKPLSYEELWKNTRYFWRFLGASILYGLIVLLGFLLLMIPGIIWAIKYQFVTYLIIDKDMGIREAFKKGGEITQGIKWDLFIFDLLLLGIIILGALAFGIGLFVAIPVTWIAAVLVYRKLLQESNSNQNDIPATNQTT